MKTRGHTSFPPRALLPGVAEKVKRSIVTANRHDSEPAMGSEVGRGVDVRDQEQQADAQPYRKASVLQETFLWVLRAFDVAAADQGMAPGGHERRNVWACGVGFPREVLLLFILIFAKRTYWYGGATSQE